MQHVLVQASILQALQASVNTLRKEMTIVQAQVFSIHARWLWPLALRELVNLGENKVQTLGVMEKHKAEPQKEKKKREKVERDSFISDEALSAYHNTQLLGDLELPDLEILYDHTEDSIRGDGNTAAHEFSMMQQREALLSSANHPWYSNLCRIFFFVHGQHVS